MKKEYISPALEVIAADGLNVLAVSSVGDIDVNVGDGFF